MARMPELCTDVEVCPECRGRGCFLWLGRYRSYCLGCNGTGWVGKASVRGIRLPGGRLKLLL